MSIVALCAAGFAGFALVIHLASHALAAWRLFGRLGARRPAERARVSLVQPLRGIEPFSARTIEAALSLDHPDHEVIFCVAESADPVLVELRAALARHPDREARILIGAEAWSGNPKLDNMAKGYRAATGEWVVFADSNLLMPPDYLTRVLATWRDDTGLVSGPPVGSEPGNFWAEVECALLNTYAARWQYAVDALGFGFAQGKTLAFRRADLAAGGFAAMASEPAEDAAATKFVRSRGQRVRLVAPAFPQPIGKRDLRAVWARHLRWARLRRVTFPALFAPEIASSVVLPLLGAVVAAEALGMSAAGIAAGFWCAWYLPEWLLATRAGWTRGWRMPFACLFRDAMMLALWVCAWTGRGFTWHGQAMRAERGVALDTACGP